MLNVIPYIILTMFFTFLFYECLPKKKEKPIKSSPLLFNASVTEKGVPANQVFETLKKNNIKVNFLGENKTII